MSKAAAEWVEVDEIEPWDQNPRENEAAVITVAKSIERFGFGSPIVARSEDRVVIAGHTRLKAARLLGLDLVPVRFVDLSPVDARLLALADNKAGEIAEWSSGLSDVLRDLENDGADLDGLGWTPEELAELFEEEPLGFEELDEVEERQDEEADSKPGSVYLLGPHRLVCGDSRDLGVVEMALNGEAADLLHADPPYGMGKEAEGVVNDNLYAEKLDAFQMSWIRPWLDVTTAIGSFYIWGNPEDLWRLWFRGGLFEQYGADLVFRSEIVWDKGSSPGMRAARSHTYQPGSERCLFFMRGEQYLGNVNAADLWEGFEPFLAYMQEQMDRSGMTRKQINRLTNTHMAGHWFGRSQFCLITEDHYRTIQAAAPEGAFAVDYDELFARFFPEAKPEGGKVGASDVMRLMRSQRSYFDITHGAFTEVWPLGRVQGDERHDHATPKPVELIERIVRTSCPPGGIVAEPFGGSGTTLIASANAGRRCVTVEIDPRYCDTIRRRWGAYARRYGLEAGSGALL